jgi:hypothetical protein
MGLKQPMFKESSADISTNVNRRFKCENNATEGKGNVAAMAAALAPVSKP